MGAMIRHASTVAFGPDRGVVIIGPSGSGKSALALALMADGAQLVADDRTVIWPQGGALYARAPVAIAGLIERRGMGLMRVRPLRLTRLRLAVDLTDAETRRLPPEQTLVWLGITLPCLRAPVPGDRLYPTFPAAVRHYIHDGSFGA